MPIADGDLRVLHRRPRGARHGPRPDLDLQGDLRGHGLQWLFPWTTGADREIAAINLQQTLLSPAPLILLGLAVALRVPRRPVQHRRPGPVHRRLGRARCGSARRTSGMPHVLHVVLAMVWRRARGRRSGPGSRACCARRPGANEVITTIMLNYIALWLGVYLFGLGGPLQYDTPARRPDLQRRRARTRGCPCSGATRSCRACTSASSSRSSPRSSSGCCSTARRRATRRGRSASTPRRRGRAASASGGRTSWSWRPAGAGRPGRVARHARLAVPHRDERHAGRRSSASSGSPSRCWGATPRSARASRRCCSARWSAAPRCATSTRRSSSPSLAQNLTTVIQGLVVLFVSADARAHRGVGCARAATRTATGGGEHDDRDRRRRLGVTGARGPRAGLGRRRARRSSPFFITLPPFEVRPPVPSLVARAAWRRGWASRRCAAATSGAGVGRRSSPRCSAAGSAYGATQADLDKLEVVVAWGALTAATLRYATPLMFAGLGGLVSERAGVVNIGLEGMMLMGAFFAAWGADKTGSWVVGILIGVRRRHGAGRDPRDLRRSRCAPTRSSAAPRSTSSRSASRATCTSTSTARRGRPTTCPQVPERQAADRVARLHRPGDRQPEPARVGRAAGGRARVGRRVPHARSACGCGRSARTRARPRPSASASTGCATSR